MATWHQTRNTGMGGKSPQITLKEFFEGVLEAGYAQSLQQQRVGSFSLLEKKDVVARVIPLPSDNATELEIVSINKGALKSVRDMLVQNPRPVLLSLNGKKEPFALLEPAAV